MWHFQWELFAAALPICGVSCSVVQASSCEVWQSPVFDQDAAAASHGTLVGVPGGSGVLVNQLRVAPLTALEALTYMAEGHSALVWDSLLSYSGTAHLYAEASGAVA